MSQVYSTEPQTAGRVILETTHGPLEIALWSRECPATTRYFLQLCIDGYYDNTLFHRIVPNFLIQTGALRHDVKRNKQTSLRDVKQNELQAYRRRVQGDEALDRRSYELNSRIRFNHRGQVAMALEVTEADNGEESMIIQPQFFITLDEASELDGKHVCFGTVTGPTIFNALRIGRTDIDEETNQPTILEEAPRIEHVKIVENPIHSTLVPSTAIPWRMIAEEDALKKKRKKRKGVKNMNVLSFGDEMEQETDVGGMKSSHDVIAAKNLSNEVDQVLKEAVEDSKSSNNSKVSKPHKTTKSMKEDRVAANNDFAESRDQKYGEEEPSVNEPYSIKFTPAQKRHKERVGDESTIGISQEATTQKSPNPAKEKIAKVSLVEARRAKYAKRGSKDKRKREDDTMAKFMAFQRKVSNYKDETSASHGEDDIATRMSKRSEAKMEEKEDDIQLDEPASYHGQILENDEDVRGDWMKTNFKCRKHQDHDSRLGGDGRSALDDYEVVDDKHRESNKRRKHKHRHHKKDHGISSHN